MLLSISIWIDWSLVLTNVYADGCTSNSETTACKVPIIEDAAKCATRFEKIACKGSMSSSSSVLRCNHECLESTSTIFEIPTEMDNFFSSSHKLLMHFFTNQSTSNEQAFTCNEDLVLASDVSNYSQYDEHCNQTNHLMSEFKKLIKKLSITELEIYNFTDLTMIFNDSYPDMFKLNIHSVLGYKWNTDSHWYLKKEIQFPKPLRHLYVTNNQFTLLNRDIFWNLQSLESLDLSQNKLRSLKTGQFRFLGNLTYLNLSHNSILQLEGNTFIDLIELRDLDVSSNLLETLPYELFANQRNLRHLNISRNRVKELEYRNLFRNVLNMRRIDLSMNNIKLYSKHLFDNQDKLAYADISFNRLTKCPRFRNHRNLEFLNLSHNRIDSLSKYCFKNSSLLKVYIIRHNRIRELYIDNLKYLKDLEILDASENRITTITRRDDDPIKIHKINLSKNNVLIFPPAVWQLLPHLEVLDLSFNQLTSIVVPSCFPVMHNNIRINLAFNFISFYEIFPWLNEEKQSENVNKINECLENEIPKVFLNLSYNPQNFINENSIKTFIDPQSLRCFTHEYIEDVSIDRLPKEVFSCPFKINCPEDCTCGILFKDKSVFVNCTGAGLDMVVQNPPSGSSVLFFSHNYLKNLSSLNIVEWSNLTHLYADYNSLETLEGWIIPPKLQYLSIRGNKLKFLSRDLYDFISSRDSFELLFGGNSRNCNCDSEGMKRFLNRYQEFVPDVKDIICDYENDGFMVSSPLQSISTSVLCGITSNLIQNITIILFLSSITFILGMILLYYKHRYLILSYLYVHCRKAICFNFDEDDDDKIFDAFVAYSSFDRQIVEEILQELEEKEPHFKLCIHERDWLPGRYINENIIKSVQSSKRTILVISENFISSPWFKLELNAAVSKFSKDEMNPIIVVMVNNSTTWKRMDKEFRHVVSKRTYLVYGERWFWEKLRYAMPKKTCANTDL